MDALPAVLNAGCFAAVAAPVGRLTVPLMLLMFQVPDCAACTANVPVPTTVAFRFAAVPWDAVTVPDTGCVVLPVGLMRSGFELVPTSTPLELRRTTGPCASPLETTPTAIASVSAAIPNV